MKTNKLITSSIIALTLLGASLPSFAYAESQTSNPPVSQSVSGVQDELEYFVLNDTLITNITPETKINENSELSKAINEISEMYSFDAQGNVVFSGTVNDLVSLGFSEDDAKLAISEADSLVSQDSYARGFVGLHINFGPQVKKMNAWVASTFVGGYVAFQLKAFAVNPVTAGVVGVISSGIGVAVYNAVKKHYNRISVGVYLPHYSKAFNVRTP